MLRRTSSRVRLKQDGTHRATLFDSGVDWNGVGCAGAGSYFSCRVRVGVAQHHDQVWWETHVVQGGENSGMGDTAKSVPQVQPGDEDVFLEASSISNYGLQHEAVFIAPLGRSGAFLLCGEQVVFDGPAGHAFSKDAHKQFVDAGHQSYRAKVGHVIRCAFLVDEDRCRRFPHIWNVLLFDAVAEDGR